MNKIRLSHSALDLLNTCERKFQLDRLLATTVGQQDYSTTVFGRAYGAGMQTYLITQDINKAVFSLWLAYEPALEDERRSIWICINALINAVPTIDTFLLDWESVSFNNKSTSEMSFRLEMDDKFYYVGYIDVVMKNKYTKRLCIVEIKTTGLTLLDLDPVFANSGQAVGYSIVLDRIAGYEQAEYDVIYIICQLGSGNGFSPLTHIKVYPKTIEDRLNWFLTLGMDRNRLERMIELNYFPKRGQSCLKYNRPCHHFGVCHLHNLDRPAEIEEDTIEYQFHYDLNEIIQEHIRRANNA